ncbi:YagK/YfjJ domain-containing protein [Crenobacter intestini]|uniref:Inovirus Gp2 family protein n=1 Tax=Crenobacter intestini TaxID=2563443 RepID=A0A4T0UPQ8_9NEIS|nr:inovirus-type Gp2 protein [Crenobacter intestini]TIC80536.1 inovirus Gp2 family protein [Crenobacter intestini]
MKKSSAMKPFDENGLMSDMTTRQVIHGEKGDAIFTHALTAVAECFFAENTLRKIVLSDHQLIKINKSSHPKGSRIDQLAKDLFTVMQGGFFHLQRQFPKHEFPPLVTMLFQIVDGSAIFSNGDEWTSDLYGRHFYRLESKINQLAHVIRTRAQEDGIISSALERKRHVIKNVASFDKYITRLFEHYSKLLVVRIDLAYLRDSTEDITPQTASRHLDLMLKNYKIKKQFKGVVGYAAKIEMGMETGCHIHLMLFFDGARHCRDVYIAKQIGEYWKDKVTKGIGRYHSCNANATGYKNYGIGMVNRTDIEKIAILRKTALYLVKADYYIRLLIGNNKRTFRRGEMPPLLPPKPGRRPKMLGDSSVVPPADKSCQPQAALQQQQAFSAIPSSV